MPDWHEGLISADWHRQGAHGHPVPRGRKPSCQALSGPGSRKSLAGRARSGCDLSVLGGHGVGLPGTDSQCELRGEPLRPQGTLRGGPPSPGFLGGREVVWIAPRTSQDPSPEPDAC